jgi:hypothetical protein
MPYRARECVNECGSLRRHCQARELSSGAARPGGASRLREDAVSTTREQGPGFEIEYAEYPGYLRVLVSGPEDSPRISVAYWTAIGRACVARGVQNLLVIEDLPPYPQVGADDFEAVTSAMADAGLDKVRVAFVDAQEEVEANEYGMIVGAEKGLNIMMFSNESYAARWLRFGPDSVAPDRRG